MVDLSIAMGLKSGGYNELVSLSCLKKVVELTLVYGRYFTNYSYIMVFISCFFQPTFTSLGGTTLWQWGEITENPPLDFRLPCLATGGFFFGPKNPKWIDSMG